jgi:hypothetical protein
MLLVINIIGNMFVSIEMGIGKSAAKLRGRITDFFDEFLNDE